MKYSLCIFRNPEALSDRIWNTVCSAYYRHYCFRDTQKVRRLIRERSKIEIGGADVAYS